MTTTLPAHTDRRPMRGANTNSGIDHGILSGFPRSRSDIPADDAAPPFLIERAQDSAELTAYYALRKDLFVYEQRLFASSDHDDHDEDHRTVVLVARAHDGSILGGVRIHPAVAGRDIGWWRGSRLVVAPTLRRQAGIGAALVRSACAWAQSLGALRFDATIQAQNQRFFEELGWIARQQIELHAQPHVVVDWPIDRIRQHAAATKSALGELLSALHLPEVVSEQGNQHPHNLGGVGFRGDDGAPVPGSDVVAACDAILPAMVERDPEWAGWCAVLVNLNDLFAMGARPVGLLDALAARDASFARRVLSGVVAAARAWDVPILGGHTQFGVPAALSVTALGLTNRPVPGGGGRPGEVLRVTADLGGSWRPGYGGAQWDSSSHRSHEQLRQLASVVPDLTPQAAKDVSMAGLVGTTGMLAESSGCRAELNMDSIPAPNEVNVGDWLTCFPGFAMVSTHADAAPTNTPDFLTSRACGALTAGSGVGLRWPDGVMTEAIASPVTGLGPA